MSKYTNGNGQSNSMPLIPITGLYKKTNKAGQTYLTGKLNAKTRICVMPALSKNSDTDPDYVVMIGVAFPPVSATPGAPSNPAPSAAITQQDIDL